MFASGYYRSGKAQAQELIAKSISDSFVESFDDVAPSSGIPLAGLAIGRDQNFIEIDDVHIAAPLQQPTTVCITGRTRDGRYYSENLYLVPASTKSKSIAVVDPLTLQYQDALRAYASGSFVLTVRAVPNENCGEKAKFYLPRVINSRSELLFINVNSGSGSARVSATISAASDVDAKASSPKALRHFECQTLRDGANIAFDTVCSVNVSPYWGNDTEIIVSLDDGFGPLKARYRVLIPNFGD